jgi:hypothetical protein
MGIIKLQAGLNYIMKILLPRYKAKQISQDEITCIILFAHKKYFFEKIKPIYKQTKYKTKSKTLE